MLIKRVIGIIVIASSFIGFYFFIDYLIFELKGYGDNGLGSYAYWASGMVGLFVGLLLLIIGLSLVVPTLRRNKTKEN